MTMDLSKYPKNWKAISYYIRFVRAGGVCEICRKAKHGEPHPETGSRVVLTVAHLDHSKSDNEFNMKAACQKCHLAWDRARHVRKRKHGWEVPEPFWEDNE